MEILGDHPRDKIRIVYRSQLNATWDGTRLDIIERRGSVCQVSIAADQVGSDY